MTMSTLKTYHVILVSAIVLVLILILTAAEKTMILVETIKILPSLAWPVGIIIIVNLFKNELKELIKLKDIQLAVGDITFQIKSAQKTVEEIQEKLHKIDMIVEAKTQGLSLKQNPVTVIIENDTNLKEDK